MSHRPAPLLVPGIGNALGIQATPLFVLGLASHDTASGRGVWSTPTPPLPVGVIPVQAVTFVGGGAPHFTSTAAITIVPRATAHPRAADGAAVDGPPGG